MPSTSKAQSRFMAGCARNPEKMKGKCPPKRVAREYHKADKSSGIMARRKAAY